MKPGFGLALLALAAAPVAAQPAQAPKFASYPAAAFHGPRPPLQMTREQRFFRTTFRLLHAAAPNFAGHYSIGTIGCGAGCAFLFAVDLKTGRPVDFDVPNGEPLEHCDDEYRDAKGESIFHEFFMRPGSRLLVVTGKMPGLACGARYFEERNGRMVMLRDVALPAPGPVPATVPQ